VAALGERKIGQAGRAKRAIKSDRDHGQSDQSHDGRHAAQPDIGAQGRPPLIVRRCQQPPADLDARGLSFRRVDETRDNIALDFRELIPVDRGLGTGRLCAVTAAKRPEHGKDRRGRHQREHKPQRHRAGSGEKRRNSERRLSPLYTTGGRERQLTIIKLIRKA
jgi:hypothetical protein